MKELSLLLIAIGILYILRRREMESRADAPDIVQNSLNDWQRTFFLSGNPSQLALPVISINPRTGQPYA